MQIICKYQVVNANFRNLIELNLNRISRLQIIALCHDFLTQFVSWTKYHTNLVTWENDVINSFTNIWPDSCTELLCSKIDRSTLLKLSIILKMKYFKVSRNILYPVLHLHYWIKSHLIFKGICWTDHKFCMFEGKSFKFFQKNFKQQSFIISD